MLIRRVMLLALMLPAVMGCVSNSVFATKSDCSQLVPATWRSGVANAPAPERSDDDLERLKAWINFGVAQTGQLAIANSRTDDAIGIIERCEARDRQAIERAKPKFLGIF